MQGEYASACMKSPLLALVTCCLGIVATNGDNLSAQPLKRGGLMGH